MSLETALNGVPWWPCSTPGPRGTGRRKACLSGAGDWKVADEGSRPGRPTDDVSLIGFTHEVDEVVAVDALIDVQIAA